MEYDITEIDEGVKEYMRSLQGFKPLSKEEEHKLLESYRRYNDLSARNKLITSNLKYACKLAQSYRGRGVPFKDLISEANDGLIHAIDEFDMKHDVKIFSYAKWWIMQRMQDLINKTSSFNNEELPTENECQELDDDDELFTDEKITDNNFIDENFDTTEIDYKNIIDEILSTIGERECKIIKMYYGIDTNTKYTLDEIGEEFGLSKERIRQIMEKAFKKLRTQALLNYNIDYFV